MPRNPFVFASGIYAGSGAARRPDGKCHRKHTAIAHVRMGGGKGEKVE